MFKKIRNKKGLAGLVIVQAVAGLIALAVGRATVETGVNGTLKKDGKVVWCKMQGKSAQYCNDTYGYQNR